MRMMPGEGSLEDAAKAFDLRIQRLRTLGERYRVSADALFAVRLLSDSGDALGALEGWATNAFEYMDRLGQLSPQVPDFEALLDKLEAEIERIDARILEVDDALQMTRAKPKAEKVPLSLEVMIRYVRFLGHHFTGKPAERCDRLDYMATRLLTVRGGTRRAMRHRNDVDPVLRYVAADVQATNDVRSAAVTFFRAALRKVANVERIEEFFDSDLYFDIRGYKVSLRESLLDPEVLYAAAEVNAGIGNKIAQLVADGTCTEQQVDARFLSANKRIEKIFGASALAAEREAEAQKKEPEEPLRAIPFSKLLFMRLESAKERRRRAVIVGSIILSALLLAGYFVTRPAIENRVVSMSSEELVRLSTTLEEGGISSGKGTRQFVGRVSRARWILLDQTQRRKEAESIRQRLLDLYDVKTAIIFNDKVPVIQIEDSKFVKAE